MSSHKIAVVIVNWNSGLQLKRCVESLEGLCPVIVVDNASSDESVQEIAKLQSVTVIQSVENMGFGKACNRGASDVVADFLLFLNPDAAVYPGTIARVVEYMEDLNNVDVGICGVRLHDESKHIARSCVKFPTAFTLFAHSIGIDRFKPRFGYFMSDWPHDETRSVDHVIGAFYFVRQSVFKSLSGFDERFFVYLEDLDFSLRARQAGWKTVYLADVQAFHAGGGTSNQVKAKRLFYSLRSRLLYAEKHFTRLGAANIIFATLVFEPIARSLLALVRRSLPSLMETWHGYVLLWRWLPHWALKGVTR